MKKNPPASENFYRTVFESTDTATIILEENNTILLANEEFETLSRYTKEEIEGRKKWMEFVHRKDDLQKMKEYHRRRRVNPLSAPHMYEFQFVDRKGQVKDIVAAVVTIADSKQSLVTLLDISDRRRMEAALTESERRLADTIDFLPDATFAIDLSGKVIAWNHAMEEMSGVKAEDMLGKGDFEYALPFYGIRRPTLIDLVFKHNEEIERHYHIVKRHGNVLIAEADVTLSGVTLALWGKAGPLYDSCGNIVGAIESFRDITELKQAEKSLQKAHDELEIRVRERTAELLEANKLLQEEITERMRAEAALTESERRLTDIIDFLPDPTYAIDLSGKVIAWNHAIEEMTGVKAEDMLGKGNHEYIIPFYGTPRPVLIDLVFECDQELARKYDFVKRDGDVLLAEAEVPVRGVPHFLWGKAGPLYDSHGNIVGAIESVRDITDRKRMEVALRESERRLGDIIDFLPDATFAIDVSGKVIAWNHAMEEMSGVKAQDMLGKGNYEYTIPFYGMRRPAMIDLALRFTDEDRKRYSLIKQEGDVIFTETNVVLGNSPRVLLGKARPLYDSKGNIAGAIESIRDITEFRQAQKALQQANEELEIRVAERTTELVQANKALQKEILERQRTEAVLEESERRYDQFFKTSRDCVFITLASGKFVDMNDSLVEVLGYSSREEMMQVDVKNLYENQNQRIRIAALVAKSGYVQEYPVEFLKKDGSKIYVLITAVALYDTDGGVIGFQGTLRDVTEQRRVEGELKRYREELENMVAERTGELENRTKNLQEINTALNVLLQKRADDKKNFEERFVANISNLVLPYVEMVKRNNLDTQQQFCLDTIKNNLNKIASPLLKNIRQFDLTPREIQVA
ncbi:MAG: PAS domain S-box protein, partial [Syntrophaceae bacterium]|nr:PAS domain S-box protein [Syntrophaceae bacterium]